MMQFSIDEVKDRILESKKINQDELDEKVKSKLVELEGVISEYGAMCIIAGELGIRLHKNKITDSQSVKLNNVINGLKGVTVVGKVSNVFPQREFETKEGRKGKLQSFIIHDNTTSKKVVLWNDKVDLFKDVKEGDIIEIDNTNIRDNNDTLEIHSSSNTIIRSSDVDIGEKPQTYEQYDSYAKDVFKKVIELDEKQVDENAIFKGKIVNVFQRDLMYEACPECNKRVLYENDKYKCSQHGELEEPKYNFIITALLDDGSGIIKTTFFGKSAERLLNIEYDEAIRLFKKEPKKIELTLNELQGKEVVLNAKVNNNQFSKSIEAIARRVFPNPNYTKRASQLLSNLS